MQGSSTLSLVASGFKLGVALFPMTLALMSAPALAQSEPTPPAQVDPADEVVTEDVNKDGVVDEEDKKIVVTGTTLRGIQPTGTNVISLGREEIQSTGINSTNQLLGQLPQLGAGYFNSLPAPAASAQGGIEINRPNARGVPSGALDTGSPTLLLLDGQRTAGAGIRSIGTDPETIPAVLLERVELNTDGGSSVYGSDGIGGVINFVTRRRFDGVHVSGRYGFADDYDQWDANVIVGKDFGSTSAFISYSHTENSPLYNRDRDYYRVIDWSTGLEMGLQCPLPNVRLGTSPNFTYYGVSASGTVSQVGNTNTTSQVTSNGIQSPNLCTVGKNDQMVSARERHNVLASFAHDFSERLQLTIRGRYAHYLSEGIRAPFSLTVSVPQRFNLGTTQNPIFVPNPVYQPIAANPTATQTVLLNFEPWLGLDDYSRSTKIESYGVSPEIRWNIDDNWELRAFYNYDRSETSTQSVEYNVTVITNSLLGRPTNGVLHPPVNPYNIEASSPGLLAAVRDFESRGFAFDEIHNARATIDGSLLELPGGKVRAAIGAEYLSDHYGRRSVGSQPIGAFDARDASGNLVVPIRETTRDVKSAFGELDIPIFGDGNALPLLHELRLSLQGRYDSYSDFGDSFNPRIGANWAPTEWLVFKGNWGTTFRAPSIIDSLGTENVASIFPTNIPQTAFLNPPLAGGLPQPTPGSQVVVFNGGTFPGIRPQTGENWSVGAEIKPFAGFRASVTYYRIKYENELGTRSPFALYNNAGQIIDPGVVTINPTAAQITDFLVPATNAANIVAQLGNSPVYMLLDLRTRNLAAVTLIGGIDYSASYNRATNFGSVFVRVSGNIRTLNKEQDEAGDPFVDTLSGSLHRVSSTAGMRVGEHLTTQLTWNRTEGFRLPNPDALDNGQNRVGSFNVFDFYAAWDVRGSGLGRDLQFTLNVNNILDQRPPLRSRNGSTGTANGSTLGRLIQFGAKLEF